MNINDFQNHVNETILDRGYEYYTNGNIVETYSQRDYEYIFQVEGSTDYEVVVILDENGEVAYSNCDCPYDFGPICKHQVAAYFQLIEILNSKPDNNNKEIRKQPQIKEVLDNLSKETLTNIILDIIEEDHTLKNRIVFKYAKVDDEAQELEKCKKLIDSIVRKYTGREGFIVYREAHDFTNELEDLLEKARGTENPLLSLDIAFSVLEESIEAYQYTDDSGGEIDFLISIVIELIEETINQVKNIDMDMKKKVFDKLLEQSDNNIFEDWDQYKVDILSIAVEFADDEELRAKLRMKIEDLINQTSSNEYRSYYNERMLRILFHMIEEYGTQEEAERFIKENIKIASFREQLINKCIKDKNYYQVIELALEGETQDEQYPGLISKWKKIRYTAYKQLSMKKEQQKLAKELLFAGDFEYYWELKQLAKGDKRIFYNNLKEELKKDRGWRGKDVYLKLIKEENDFEAIMEFLRENPNSIEEYAEMLQDKFRDEIIEIYKKHIKLSASSSSNRKQYQHVCRVVKRYGKIAGKRNQQEMINDLLSLYRKRPAFVDELNKIQ